MTSNYESRLAEPSALADVNLLRFMEVLPETFEGVQIERDGTPIFDLNGEILYRRIALQRRGDESAGSTDFAVHPALGAPLVALTEGRPWNEAVLIDAAIQAVRKQGEDVSRSEARFVAYSFPKIAVQFLREGREVALLELETWAPVPPARQDREKDEPPGNFERWSFLGELAPAARRRRERRFAERVKSWQEAFARAGGDLGDLQVRVISRDVIARAFASFDLSVLYDQRELHYSRRDSDHVTCYELRGQQTSVWCVGASVQMILDFYRHEYTQVRLAQELGLGTLNNPNGLPYSRDGDVVTVLENLTSNALNVTMNTSPTWTEFRSEIRSNRPLISFIPGHARAVAGYTRSNIAVLGNPPFRGLLVYDPWPPTTGVIARWENFDTQTYRVTYRGRVNLK